MEKFVVIDYEGDYNIAVELMKEKCSSVKNEDVFPVGNKIYTKISPDEEDDLLFFRNYEITQSPLTKYVSMENTTRDDYFQKRGEHLQRYRETKPTPVVDEQFNDLQPTVPNTLKPTLIEREVVVSCRSSQGIQGNDVMSNVLGAIEGTLLPSKQPLQKEDPFNYMISRDFMIMFMFLSLLFVNVMNIMS